MADFTASPSFVRRASKDKLSAKPFEGPLPPGMDAVHVGVPFVETVQNELARLGVKKVFVMANKSSSRAAAPLIDALSEKGMLAAPLCCDIGMGGGEEGLLTACDKAAAAASDGVVTIGGGAIQDAGKLLRLWLSAAEGAGTTSSVEGIRAAAGRDPMPALPPQVACPNSFAMAELTSVAGITTKANVKSGAAHPAMMPTVCIFDPVLTEGLPDWVRFGTALRCVEHVAGAMCSPKATEEIRELALVGARMVMHGLTEMVKDPTSHSAAIECYRGGWHAIRALNTGCYPALGHLIENHYSAKFNVHQGSCSAILCARIMSYHSDVSADYQARFSEAFGEAGTPAPRVVNSLVSTLPGLQKDHDQASVSESQLRELADFLHGTHGPRLNELSPKPFANAEDILEMLARPLSTL